MEGRIADVPVRTPADVEAVLALADEGRSWRCVNCGDRTDAVIEANRRALAPATMWQTWRAGGRQRTDGQAVPEAVCLGLPAAAALSEACEL